MAKIIKIAQKLPQATFVEIKQQLAERGKQLLIHRKGDECTSMFTGNVVNIFNLGSKVEIHGTGFFEEERASKLSYRFSKQNNEWVLTC